MGKIFLTGATGYIGGEVLYRLLSQTAAKHSVTCLVRDQAKEATILKAYPNVRVARGDLDNTDLIHKESKDADIVLSLASTKHAPSSEAIAKGLASRSSPGYWVQMSGASLFSGAEIKANRYGESGGKVYDDLKDRDEIWSLVEQTPTRVVEQLVAAQDVSKVKTALIIGPLIYGVGRGPVNPRSIQGPEISKYTLQTGKAFQVGSGGAVWSNIHVRDLSSMILALVEASTSGTDGVWNKDGVYCPDNGSMSFGDLATAISKAATKAGYTKEEGVESFNSEEVNKVMGHGAVLLGTNAKQTASRARERLRWKPSEQTLEDFIPEMVRIEAERLK